LGEKEEESTSIEAKSSETIASLRKDVDKRLGDLNTKISESLETGKKVVQEKPLLVLALAFILGVIVGALLGKKSKD
jgi:ElaB/YqjD/DUF883 family membrane-anchored ribosome-binding protein